MLSIRSCRPTYSVRDSQLNLHGRTGIDGGGGLLNAGTAGLLIRCMPFHAINRAFRAASPEVQRAVLEFHAPVDGPRAAELRQLLTGPKDAVKQSIKVGQGGDIL